MICSKQIVEIFCSKITYKICIGKSRNFQNPNTFWEVSQFSCNVKLLLKMSNLWWKHQFLMEIVKFSCKCHFLKFSSKYEKFDWNVKTLNKCKFLKILNFGRIRHFSALSLTVALSLGWNVSCIEPPPRSIVGFELAIPLPPSAPSKKFTVIQANTPSSLPSIISTALSPTEKYNI